MSNVRVRIGNSSGPRVRLLSMPSYPNDAPPLSIGTVQSVDASAPAAASITGDAPNQVLNISIPSGVDGAPNTLTIGAVQTLEAGNPAAATLTGSSPNQTLSLAIPKGAVNALLGVLASPTTVNDLTAPAVACLIADGDGVGLLNLLSDGTLLFRRQYEQSVNLGRVYANGMRWAAIVDADGVVPLSVDDFGDTTLSLSPLALALLKAKLFPDPSAVVGVNNPMLMQAKGATTRGFLAALEKLNGSASPTTMAYIQRTDRGSATTLRDTGSDPIEMIPGNGESNNTGSNDGATGGKIIHITPPATIRNTCICFNPDTFNAAFGTGARGAGGNGLIVGDIVDFVPLQEATVAASAQGETYCTGMGMFLTTQRDLYGLPWRIYLLRTHGAPGTSLYEVSPGSAAFNNWLKEIALAVTLGAKYGKSILVRYLKIDTGSADRLGGPLTVVSPGAAAGATFIPTSNFVNVYGGMLIAGASGQIPAGTIVTLDTFGPPIGINISNPLTAALNAGDIVTGSQNIAGFIANTVSLQAAYAASITAAGAILGSVLGVTGPVLIFSQLDARCAAGPVPADGQPGSAEITNAIRTAVIQNPGTMRISHPRSILLHDHGNTYHNDAPSYVVDGEYAAKVPFYEDVSGLRWAALGERVIVTRSGVNVTIQFFRDVAKTIPWGGLNFDTTTFFAALGTCEALPDGNFGFAHSATTLAGPPTISTSAAAAALGIANDQVNIVLSAAVSGNILCGYTGPGSTTHSAAWTNLFDDGKWWAPGTSIHGVAQQSPYFASIGQAFTLKNNCLTFKEPC